MGFRDVAEKNMSFLCFLSPFAHAGASSSGRFGLLFRASSILTSVVLVCVFWSVDPQAVWLWLMHSVGPGLRVSDPLVMVSSPLTLVWVCSRTEHASLPCLSY